MNFNYLKNDLLSGIVVFLVALPLCLGIAVASGANPFAGIIAGIVGGIVVGLLSNSNVSVTGPAAGLIAIVLVAIAQLGYPAFLAAVVLAGVIQLLLGFAKAGFFSSYIPNSVIVGMLTAIGIIILKKEAPHAVGYDPSNAGAFFSFSTESSEGFLTGILSNVNAWHLGVLIVTVISILILIAFTSFEFLKKIKALPGALIVVIVGVVLNELFIRFQSPLAINNSQLVTLPIPDSINSFIGQFTLPSLPAFLDYKVWIVALTIAAVASIETLLCLEAGDKMDPQKRSSNTNTELKAQGIGNIVSGLLGGIPITSVIVRTSANINAGAKTKLSAIAHGFFLLITVITIPVWLNKIPMACLAAILIMTGFKLANPKVLKGMWQKGKYQFIPFIITVIAVVFTDLLKGVGIGLAVSVLFILKGNLKLAYVFKKEGHHEGDTVHIDLAQEVSFLNKAAIKQTLNDIPTNTKVVINAEHTSYIDQDVLELIKDFTTGGAKEKQIQVSLINFKKEYQMDVTTHVHSDAH
jgi:MFS superfamily sulfate permease-like transporter